MIDGISGGLWHEWVASEEGRKALDEGTLLTGVYLYNRLWVAFTAGMLAQQRFDEIHPFYAVRKKP